MQVTPNIQMDVNLQTGSYYFNFGESYGESDKP